MSIFNINLDEENFDYCDPETIMLGLWVGIINLNNVKHLKNDIRRINTCSLASYLHLGI